MAGFVDRYAVARVDLRGVLDEPYTDWRGLVSQAKEFSAANGDILNVDGGSTSYEDFAQPPNEVVVLEF